MNLVVFNYRGFGRSEGTPSPKSVAEDTEDLVEFLLAPYKDSLGHPPQQQVFSRDSFYDEPSGINRHNHNKECRTGCGVQQLGLHGRSIGGTAAVHVAWKFSKQVK